MGVVVGCSQPESSVSAPEPAPSAPTETGELSHPPRDRVPVADPCETGASRIEAAIAAVVDEHASCEFAVDCVGAPFATACLSRCGVAVRPDGLEPLRARLIEIQQGDCPALTACSFDTPECARSSPSCVDGRCQLVTGDPILAAVSVPPENRRERSDAPPPRPPAGDVERERGGRLFAAIAADDPALAQDFFFPKEAFRHVKAIADPDGYWERLFARYAADIHALHASTPDLEGAAFDRLEIIARGGWVRIGEEANMLPYHVSRHSWLHFTVGGEARKLEVRVLITWGERWYVTHLNEHH